MNNILQVLWAATQLTLHDLSTPKVTEDIWYWGFIWFSFQVGIPLFVEALMFTIRLSPKLQNWLVDFLGIGLDD
jgi:hypothetical protein